MPEPLIPPDATRMELLVVNRTLRNMKQRILNGHPSGMVIDQALDEVLTKASKTLNRPR